MSVSSFDFLESVFATPRAEAYRCSDGNVVLVKTIRES